MLLFYVVIFTVVKDCRCALADFDIAKYQGHSQRVQTNASLTILTVYWFSLWNLCCFSVGPPTVALTASPTGGSRWHKSSTSKSQIHRRYRTIKPRPHWNTTQQTWITSIARSPACTFFFFLNSIDNSKCKSPEQMLWREKKKKKRSWEQMGTRKWGKTQRKGEKKTQVENKTTQLVHLCHWKPVKSPCVFVRVRVNKTVFEVGLQHCTVASLRPLLSPCKNVLGGYRKCYRIQS